MRKAFFLIYLAICSIVRLQFPFGVAQQSAASTIAESVSTVLVSYQEEATSRSVLFTTSLRRAFTQGPFDRLKESLQRARRNDKLQHMVVYGLACRHCLSNRNGLMGGIRELLRLS
jgi:hypothetical protein